MRPNFEALTKKQRKKKQKNILRSGEKNTRTGRCSLIKLKATSKNSGTFEPNKKIYQKLDIRWLCSQLFNCIHLWVGLPGWPLRPWFGFWVFPAGGFFGCDCLLFPLSVLPLNSLFTSKAFKGRFATGWFPSAVLGFCWPCESTFAMSIASLVGAYRLNHCYWEKVIF